MIKRMGDVNGKRRHSRSAWTTVVVLLACIGCGSSVERGGDESNLVSYPELQVAHALGLDAASDNADASGEVQRMTHIETFATCMREKGFDGFPVVLPEPQPTPSPREPDNIEWVREYGFGIATLSTANFRTGSSGGSGKPDELEQYIQTLTQEAQDEMRREFDGSVDSTCGAQADAAVESLEEVQNLTIYADAVDEIRTRVSADPRAQAALKDYARCMADNGYAQMTTPEESVKAISDAFAEWISTVGFNPSSSPEDEFVDQLDDASRDRLVELRMREVETAVQSFACEVPARPTLVEVSIEVEQAWIVNNQDRLGG